jgi:peptidyl-prolyl cis-trans isomerase C
MTSRWWPAAALMFLAVTSVASGETPASDAVLIESDKAVVRASDFEGAMARIPENIREGYLASPKRVRTTVDQLYLAGAAAADARANGIDKRPDVQARIRAAVDAILADEQVKHLIAQSQTPDFEAAAEEHYLTHKQEYVRREQVEAAHILIRTEDRGDEEALALIKKLRADVLNGASFQDLAKEYSEDKGSARRGGRLGFFSRGQMVKPFDEAAFALKEGQISEPVKTEYGYHIILVERRVPEGIRPFGEVKEKIVKNMKKGFEQRIREDYMIQLRDAPGITVHEEAIQALIADIPHPQSKADSAQ